MFRCWSLRPPSIRCPVRHGWEIKVFPESAAGQRVRTVAEQSAFENRFQSSRSKILIIYTSIRYIRRHDGTIYIYILFFSLFFLGKKFPVITLKRVQRFGIKTVRTLAVPHPPVPVALCHPVRKSHSCHNNTIKATRNNNRIINVVKLCHAYTLFKMR